MTKETQEVAVVEEASNDAKSVQSLANYQINNPTNTLKLAKELTRFVEEQGLFSVIQKKKFVNVEGWQFALSQLGLVPIVTDVVDQSTREEIVFHWKKKKWRQGQFDGYEEVSHETKAFKYLAKCEIMNINTNAIVGRGFAICSNEEKEKHTFDEYAVLSMAQTRSISKASRLLVGWLMKASGFESTPAEEINEHMREEAGDSGSRKKVVFNDEIKKKINSFRSAGKLLEYASSDALKDIHKDKDFRACVKTRLELLAERIKKREASKKKTTTKDTSEKKKVAENAGKDAQSTELFD